MELVVDMMREAEILEERAKQAKEAASSAGQDIFMKVEELKQMLQHANKANDMVVLVILLFSSSISCSRS